MRYFANPSTPLIREAMTTGELGCIVTPAQRLTIPERAAWAADNGRYGKGWPGERAWLDWLGTIAHVELCEFATAPDVVGDAAATLRMSAPLLGKIRELGLPAALVAQDGLVPARVPWDELDVLFIGGTDLFKLGVASRVLAHAAHEHGKHVHMGRVNSGRRWRFAKSLGCRSVDGTFLLFAPDHNLGRLRAWTHERDLLDELDADDDEKENSA